MKRRDRNSKITNDRCCYFSLLPIVLELPKYSPGLQMLHEDGAQRAIRIYQTDGAAAVMVNSM